jgi:hypothetical protein
MAAFIKLDGIDGEIENTIDQPNPPSWGLDRVDQRNLPVKDADPFLAYGEPPADIGLSIIYMNDAPAPADGFILVVTPVLDPAAIGLVRAEFIYG